MDSTNLLREIKKNGNKAYKQALLSKYLIDIKNNVGLSEREIERIKILAFILSSKIIIKSINNFFSLIKNSEFEKNNIVHEEQDIMIECFIVFENCVKNLKISKIKYFPFYLNNALNRAIFRIYNKSYNKYQGTIQNTDDNEKYLLDRIKGDVIKINTFDIDLMCLSDFELQIVESRYVCEKAKEFCDRTNTSMALYKETLEIIKKKLEHEYK
jgi:hypothetical protein